MVLQAHDARCAAIWPVHRTLSQTLPFLSEEPQDCLAAVPEGRLGETLRVSEQGFDRLNGELFDTLDIVTEWNHLLVALDRLQDSTS